MSYNKNPHEIYGVAGWLFQNEATPYRNQQWISEGRPIPGYGRDARLFVVLQFGVETGNGTGFTIRGEVRVPCFYNKQGRVKAIGVMEEEIREHFPELVPLLRWHLVSKTHGPLHYISNTLYHAGDRDHNGRKAGEPSHFEYRIYFSDGNVAHEMERGFLSFLKSRMREVEPGIYEVDKAAGKFEVVSVPYEGKDDLYPGFDDKYTFVGFGNKWHECPFDDELTALEWAEALNTGSYLKIGEPTLVRDRVYLDSSKVSHKLDDRFAKFMERHMREVEPGRYTVDQPIGGFKVARLSDDKYTFVGFGDKWHDCPFNDELTAREWAEALNTGSCVIKKVPIEFSAGKERDLEAARRSACWPEATDEDLMVEPEELRKVLEERLPDLLEEFRVQMEKIGFMWEPKLESAPPGPKM